MNTPQLIQHERIIYLPGSAKDNHVDELIAISDIMIHCRWEGETFGLAVAEFLLSNKPILTWSGSRERNHIFLADRSALFYNDQADLYRLLISISHSDILKLASKIPLHLTQSLKKEYIAPLLNEFIKPFT